MIDRRALAAAELVVLDLEDELAAAKEYGGEGPDYMELKLRLREARREYRSLRADEPAGDGAARPETVNVTSGVE